MRIAMLSVHSSPLARLGGKEAGGMNVYVRELGRELGRRGIGVDIFTRSQEPGTPRVIALDRGVRVVNLQAGPLAPYDKNLLLDYLPEFMSRVRCFADGEDLSYDLLHSHYWISGEAALALRRSWGVPVVHMFHTLGAMKNQVARSDEERETGRRIDIERLLMSEADAIIAATPLDRAQMVWHYGADADAVSVVPCGVDLGRFQPRAMADARAALDLPPPPHRLLLLVGRIEPLKGIDALIMAMARIFEQQPALRGRLTALVVGGEGEDAPARWNAEQRRLDALRHELGIADAIRFVGARTQD
ncbi:MAG TPA: glycosyltransferase, partial [Roseiflexaceae bacterium]|nr:glycosyltransferase [Roseiflexaceae bacterium]